MLLQLLRQSLSPVFIHRNLKPFSSLPIAAFFFSVCSTHTTLSSLPHIPCTFPAGSPRSTTNYVVFLSTFSPTSLIIYRSDRHINILCSHQNCKRHLLCSYSITVVIHTADHPHHNILYNRTPSSAKYCIHPQFHADKPDLPLPNPVYHYQTRSTNVDQ